MCTGMSALLLVMSRMPVVLEDVQSALQTSSLSLLPRDTLIARGGSEGEVQPTKSSSWLVRRDFNSPVV